MSNHTYFECAPFYICQRASWKLCEFCDKGVKYCIACGGADKSLTMVCPGVRLTPERLQMIYDGTKNFDGYEWFNPKENK